MRADIAIVTETWLGDQGAEVLGQELSGGSDLGLLTRNRPPNQNGVCYGGVAVVWKKGSCCLKKAVFKNKEGFEVLVATGSLRGHTRKLVVLAAYLPPSYTRVRGSEALTYIEDVIIEIKRKYSDPYLVIGGDFNQWRVSRVMDNFADIREVDVGNTRGNRSIDKIFINMSRSVVESGTLLPLETEGQDEAMRRRSDHKLTYCRLLLEKKKAFRWEVYKYRRFNDSAVARFWEWIVMYDWAEVLDEDTSDGKANAYQGTVLRALSRQ